MSASQDLVAHIPRLRRYARALTRDANLADDLVQDTLERALLKLDLWRPASDLRAWLFTLMHNIHVNRVRSRRPPGVALEEAFDVAASDGPMDAMAVLDLHAALMRLPEELRAVVLLVGLEQFAYAEAAGILGLPVGTVMSRLSRGRERLRQILAGEPAVKLKVVK